MEPKALKTQIYSNETLFTETAELPVDADFMLPDYCKDIVKILKCRAKPYIASKALSGGTLNLDGNVIINIIYADTDNRICAYEYRFPFNKAIETKSDCDQALIQCEAKCEYMNCRAVTGRKVDIHGAVGISVKTVARKSCEIITDFDDKSVEMYRGTVPATTPMGTAEKYLTVEETIEIGQGQPSVSSLIRFDADAAVKESKLLNGKNIVRGELCLSVLYCSVKNTVQKFKAQIPISQLLEIPGANDTCRCDTSAQVANIEIKPETDTNGEIRRFSVNAKILIVTVASCEDDVEVILDAYSRKCEANITHCDVTLQKISRVLNENCKLNAKIDFPEDSIQDIADMYFEVQSVNAKSEEGKITVYGTLLANITAYDSKGQVSYYEKPVEFKYGFAIEEKGNISCEPKINIRSQGFTITGSQKMDVQAELNIYAAIYTLNKISPISQIKIDSDKKIINPDACAMTVYFASKGEKVWDIARKYRACVDVIKSVNNIDECIEEDKMILIPAE